jgi:hypothetical protein
MPSGPTATAPTWELSKVFWCRFGAAIDYAQLQKIYGAPAEHPTRCSPVTCIGCDMKVVSGNPDPKHVSTSFVVWKNWSD